MLVAKTNNAVCSKALQEVTTEPTSQPPQATSDGEYCYEYPRPSEGEGGCGESSLPDPSPQDKEDDTAQPTLRLPLEVITIILEYLDARTLVTCRETSRLLHHWIDDTTSLRYIIELAVAGMDDGPPSNLTVGTRLKLLREHQTAWKALSWKRLQHIPAIQTACRCVGGILAFLSPFPNQSVIVKQLPSIIRGIQERDWTVDFPFTISDFIMDPGQDLLVIVTTEQESFCSVLPCALSSGAMHPLAFGPLEHRGTRYVQGAKYHIEIFKNVVAVQHVFFDHLVIWDWKTGHTMLDISEEMLEYSILSERYIITAVPGADRSNPVLGIYDLDRVAVGGSLLCSLQFPAPYGAPKYSRFFIRCDLTSGQTAHPSRTVPFSPSQDDRLYVIRSNTSILPVVLFVPLSTFMAVINACKIEDAPHTLTWNEWGEKGTCMDYLGPWDHSVHAMKFAWVCGGQVEIHDFNQRPFKYDRREEPESRTVLEDYLFRERIPSFLDYRIRIAQVPGSCSVLLTEDSLIVRVMTPSSRDFMLLTF